ncbi:CysS/YqeB C-terminal domain-containing protein [Nocardia sp. NBC_00565]|uniref:CysS/YqeB C-terminal domain-containing protein n=1 Tax=Nocardia sp. NBC_00565 TaxID=2975993 RepID=UPI003FA5A89A
MSTAPWGGENDPYGAEFRRRTDGRPETGEAIDALKRPRRAVSEKKPLVVDELDEKLVARGADVRDRKGEWQIRIGSRPS